jgi:peroxiredoxin
MAGKEHKTSVREAATNRQRLQQELAREKVKKAKRRLIVRIASVAGVVVVASLVVFGLLSARPTDSTAAVQAPAFALKTTAGTTASLSDYRGKTVILYFNEGAGCGACSQQMASIEKNPGFAEAGITVLPIVMNTRAQIQPDLDSMGVKTPYLLDDGTVSKAYDVLGKGMHANLPGHGFVLIDGTGIERWQAEYPSMWLDPADLLKTAKSKL